MYVILGVRLEVRRREQGVGASEQAGQGLHQDQGAGISAWVWRLGEEVPQAEWPART